MLLEAAPGQSKGSMSRAGVGVNGVNCVNWAVSLAGDQTQLRGVRAGERLRHPDSGGWRPGRRPEIRALCVSNKQFPGNPPGGNLAGLGSCGFGAGWHFWDRKFFPPLRERLRLSRELRKAGIQKEKQPRHAPGAVWISLSPAAIVLSCKSDVAVNPRSWSDIPSISHPGCIRGNEAASRLAFGIFASFTCRPDVLWGFLQHRELTDGSCFPSRPLQNRSSKAVVLWQLKEKFIVFFPSSSSLVFLPEAASHCIFPYQHFLVFAKALFPRGFVPPQHMDRGDPWSGTPAWNAQKCEGC